MLGGLVAHQFEGGLAFDLCLALGDQALEIDRLHLAAVLFALGALLGLLVVVELAVDPFGGAMKDVHGRPEEIVEVGFEARVLQGHDQGVEDVGDRARDRVAVRQKPLIGFVGERPVAVELQFVEDVVSR
ncbi:hypothetical protein BN961_03713 [Afipia felis]|uniref:Uncharacterized protein n=1 Tax=Afipia felis TaxID=1035 RepID=A0A090MSE3_AFIFE|nr:hypothetical protein BN961_03713 [Afipia felis]